MKKPNIVIALALALALLITGVLPAIASPEAEPQVTGWLAADQPEVPDRAEEYCWGNVKLMSDGTVEGEWHWILGEFSCYRCGFDSLELTSLTFPQENIAILTGQFHYQNTCEPDYNEPVPLIFVITSDKYINNGSLTTILIYSADNIPIQRESEGIEVYKVK
jgi:hypothetical protein